MWASIIEQHCVAASLKSGGQAAGIAGSKSCHRRKITKNWTRSANGGVVKWNAYGMRRYGRLFFTRRRQAASLDDGISS
jgi:hypothetical protein